MLGAGRFDGAVTTGKLLNPPSGVDEFLLAGEEGVTGSTDANFYVLASRARVVNGPTCAGDRCFVIIGVQASFHVFLNGSPTMRGFFQDASKTLLDLLVTGPE